MRIAVTGGTGYLGAHSVAALLADGHDIRLLVAPNDTVPEALRDVERESTGAIETLTGDIRVPEVVDALLDGCDAVLHMAGVVGTDNRREQLMWEVNVDATSAVLAKAVAAGLDPVVHVASYSALFPCPDPVIGPDSPTAPGRSAYGRTKSTADRIARALQATGAPVVITYPSSVVGPALGTSAGITAAGWDVMVRTRLAPRVPGGMQMIDVRDVAAVHAAVMRPGRGPKRYLCGGHLVTFDEIVDMLETGLGKPIRRIPLSPAVFRGMGRVGDLVSRVLPISAGLSYEAAWLLTAATPTDDSRTLEELNLTWRPLADSIAEAVRI
ncbi:NAD-dependent epimerase/dehydratase family protein [Nocardia paucivorans]|uniref:NAD-dependent epimerase/dehydratase family protein n=1 Tax=Nocardia paucivorans TaxID=114259 RepID=UPI00031A81C9|nr:NAD-dependent epimerase/dehydratase family protein [Nocardia paucivorans]